MKKMTIEEIRAYILDSLKKTGNKPKTVITFEGEEPTVGYLYLYGVSSKVKKGVVEYAGTESVNLMVIDEAHPKKKEFDCWVPLDGIFAIADA